MQRTIRGITLVLFLVTASARSDDRIDLRVLYCGDPGSQREADFRTFLDRHFTKVTTQDSPEFKEEQAKDADVVIFDWSPLYDDKGDIDSEKIQRMRAAPKPSVNFVRPTILIGARGGTIAETLKLKINWHCLCLNGPAHKLALDHPLFHKPLEVKPELEEIPTREEYPDQTIEKTLGPTMKVWRVQSKDYPQIDPGLVSDLYGFTDSPDAEVFAQGIALSGPDTLSLGRQANFFLWGYSASPADMTLSGQRLFVNVVAYMRQFDGQAPLVRRVTRSREWALRYALKPQYLTEEGIKKTETRYRENLETMLKENPGMFPKEAKDNPQEYIRQRVEDMRKNERDAIYRYLPEPLCKELGMDADKYLAYYKENFEYLRPEGGESMKFVVDDDAQSIGTSNRSVETLNKCVTMLEQNDRSELALRLLKRYTQENFETAAKWREWLDKNRGQLFFSDVGGFKFFVTPASSNGARP